MLSGIINALFGNTSRLTGASPFSIDRATAPFDQQLTEVPAFFEEFRSKGTPPKRDPFETDAEYAARLPAPLDQQRVFYFAMPPPEYNPAYQYNVDSQLLSVYGSYFSVSFDEESSWYGKLKVQIRHDDAYAGSHNVQNTFGAKYSVRESLKTSYYFHLDGKPHHYDSLLQQLGPHSGRDISKHFCITVPMERSLARATVEDVCLVVGLGFYSWARSKFTHCGGILDDVTIDRPNLDRYALYDIDARFVSLQLVNRKSGMKIVSYTRSNE